jgi:hypothetical protein
MLKCDKEDCKVEEDVDEFRIADEYYLILCIKHRLELQKSESLRALRFAADREDIAIATFKNDGTRRGGAERRVRAVRSRRGHHPVCGRVAEEDGAPGRKEVRRSGGLSVLVGTEVLGEAPT